MIKVVFPHSYDFGVPIARLAEIHSRGPDRGWMQKRAAVLTKEIAAIRPEKGHTFIHLVTMGAGEYYGSNRNGDHFQAKTASFEFPEPMPGGPKTRTLGPGLVTCHKTFVKYAHLYRDHVNKDPELKIGSVVAEAYNPEMRRGELIVKADNDKFADGVEKLARGEDLPFSMSARVPADYCSICGHASANRSEYCGHLKNEMTSVKQGGHIVCAYNPSPCFFDISSVFRPADRIAYGLQKVASTGQQPAEVIPSALVAEAWGVKAPRSVLFDSSPRAVQEKLAAMERLAAMEKQIEATGKALHPDVDLGVPAGSLPQESVDVMRGTDWNDLMGALSSAQVCLPVRDFFRLVLGPKYDSVAGEMDNVQSLLPGIFSRMLGDTDEAEDVTGMTTYDPATSLVPKAVRDAIESVKPELSMAEGPVRRRIQILVIRGQKPDGGLPLRKVSHDASTSKSANWLAKQYAAYQLAFTRAAEGAGDGLIPGLTVLRNYAA